MKEKLPIYIDLGLFKGKDNYEDKYGRICSLLNCNKTSGYILPKSVCVSTDKSKYHYECFLKAQEMMIKRGKTMIKNGTELKKLVEDKYLENKDKLIAEAL